MHKPLIIVLLLIVLAVLCACRHAAPEPLPTVQPSSTQQSSEPTHPPAEESLPPEGQLICRAETREAAEEIAALYGITLVDYYRNMALFYTDQDPQEIIRRGQENGWPELTRNYSANLY